MKRIILILLAMASCGWGADCANFAELEVAVHDTAAESIVLTGTTYTMTENLLIDHSCTITSSAVAVIDGDATYAVSIKDNGSTATTVNITGTATNLIKFTNTSGACVTIDSDVAALTVNIVYAYFYGATGNGNGLSIAADPAENITVSASNCKAYNNDNDGFGILTGNTNSKVVKMMLSNCDSYWNDNIDNGDTGDGGGSGDGATSHSAGHVLIVNGGNYYQNGKSGISSVGGKLFVDGANLYENGGIVNTNGDIYVTSVDSLPITNCTFTGLNTASSTLRHINTSSGVSNVYVSGCSFTNPTANTNDYVVYIGSGDTKIADIRNNIFSGYSATGSYCCYTLNAGTNFIIENNTFYNVKAGARARGGITMANNIFHTVTGYAVYDDTSDYDVNPSNGYNTFYSVVHPSLGDAVCSTDLTVDPQFKDAANGDFSLLPTSPCINTGKTTPNSGYTTIGAWQRKSYLPFGD